MLLPGKTPGFGLRSFLISRRWHGHFAAITMAALSTCFGRARRVSSPRQEKDFPCRSMRHAHVWRNRKPDVHPTGLGPVWQARAGPRNALSCAFLHLRFCMLTMRTIENEYLRNLFDVRDGADKIHRLPAMAKGRCGSLILHGDSFKVRAPIA